MPDIGKNWNGHIYGTNTGNVAVTLKGEDNALAGVIRLNDNQHSVAVYDVSGKLEAGNLALTGTPHGEAPDGVELGQLAVAGALTPEGRLDGEWSTTIGTGGSFQLWPHAYQVRATNPSAIPEQLGIPTRTGCKAADSVSDGDQKIYAEHQDFMRRSTLLTIKCIRCIGSI